MISLGGALAVGSKMNPSADTSIEENAGLWKRSCGRLVSCLLTFLPSQARSAPIVFFGLAIAAQVLQMMNNAWL
jgi:hypothetical protein